MNLIPQTVQKQNLLYYTFIVVILGTPIWWYATATYRAALPRSPISELADTRFVFSVPVSFCHDPTEISYAEASQLVTSIKPFLLLKVPKLNRVTFDVQPVVKAKCIPDPFCVMLTKTVARRHKAEIGDDGILKVSPEKEISDIGDDVIKYLDIQYLHSHVHAVSDPNIHAKNQDVKNAMAVATSYNILVTVVNPDPSSIVVNANMKEGTERYLEPFLEEIKDVASFTYQTQILRYIPLAVRPLKSTDYYYISEDNLPHLINPIESELGTSTTNDINLVIYLVDRKYTPLRIRSPSGQLRSSTSFLSPQWGTVVLHQSENGTDLDHGTTFGLLLPQLKQLLGLRASSSKSFTPRDGFLVRSRTTLVHLLRSVETLSSLIRLVDSIPNMVIGDHIKDQVDSAITDINAAHGALLNSDLDTALRHAMRARDAAEKSFSDPSILALLYFPDDQKFAIYIPLFLPVGLPLVVAFFELIKEHRRAKAKIE